jgi:Uncharacterised protein family (UPF0158)
VTCVIMSVERDFDELEGVTRRKVRASWGLLAAAFSDDTAGVRWYLHAQTGEIVRVVEDDGSPGRYLDAGFLGIERARSKEQYRWMERYIAGLDDRELAAELSRAISGKQAFHRFKAALGSRPGRTDEWYTFRSGQLTRYMRAWLRAHNIQIPLDAPFTAFDVEPDEREPGQSPHLERLETAIADLPAQELDSLLALAELLRLNARAREAG